MITYLLTHRDIDVEVLGAQAPAQIDEIWKKTKYGNAQTDHYKIKHDIRAS